MTAILIATVLSISAACILACVYAALLVYPGRYHVDTWPARLMRRLGWWWNALQWKLACIRFDISVRLANRKAGF